MTTSVKKIKPPLQKIYDALHEAWGPQFWWPGRTRLEIVVGAILTQNTAWVNVEKAIRRLKKEKALQWPFLHTTPQPILASWIRSAGYFNVKSQRIRAFTDLLANHYDGNLSRLFRLKTDALRETLLSVRGIGPETADSILLYAANRPVFVVDAYTRRFLLRHGWIDKKATYDEMAQLFREQISPDISVYNEYHALIVRLGKEYCRSQPRCEKCPLRKWLPPEGIKK